MYFLIRARQSSTATQISSSSFLWQHCWGRRGSLPPSSASSCSMEAHVLVADFSRSLLGFAASPPPLDKDTISKYGTSVCPSILTCLPLCSTHPRCALEKIVPAR